MVVKSTSDTPPKRLEETEYVVITPARNEGRWIEQTIRSVTQQTIRPIQWVIVDDGSTDDTPDIIECHAREFSWITSAHRSDRGSRNSSTGAIEAFHHGLGFLKSDDWEFIVILDSDIRLPPDYFARSFEEFNKNPQLGIGGGMLYSVKNGSLQIEVNPLFHVRGATKIYRRGCWESIGGIPACPGWDTLDEVKANMLGWRTRSFPQITALHQRPTGGAEGAWRDNVKNGRANYFLGYHPIFMFAKCFKRITEKPYFVGAGGLLYGFISGYIRKAARVGDPILVNYLRGQQMRRLLLRDTIWR